MDSSMPVASSIMKVGHINCEKDTREILDVTIGKKLNEGLQEIFGKHLVARFTTSGDIAVSLQPEMQQAAVEILFHCWFECLLLEISHFMLQCWGKKICQEPGALGACSQASSGLILGMILERSGQSKKLLNCKRELKWKNLC